MPPKDKSLFAQAGWQIQFAAYSYHHWLPTNPALAERFRNIYLGDLQNFQRLKDNDPSGYLRWGDEGQTHSAATAATPSSQDEVPSGHDAVTRAMDRGIESWKKSDAENNSSDIVNWLHLSPNSVPGLPASIGSQIACTVNLVGSPARVGILHFRQITGQGVATISRKDIPYSAGQNMVHTVLNVVPHTRGHLTIEAYVTNNVGSDSSATADLEVR